jgi:hypothetical protein
MDSRAKEKKKILAADPRRQKQKKYTTKTRKHEKKAFQPQTVNAVAGCQLDNEARGMGLEAREKSSW